MSAYWLANPRRCAGGRPVALPRSPVWSARHTAAVQPRDVAIVTDGAKLAVANAVRRSVCRVSSAVAPVVALLGASAGLGGRVWAEELDHRGPTASIALGMGYAADTGGGLGGAIHLGVGWFVTERFGVLLGLSGVTRTGDEPWVNQTVTHAAVQYWIDSGWYLRAAVGTMRIAALEPLEGGSGVTSEVELRGRGLGGLVAVGHPIVVWRRLAVNLQVAAGAGTFSDDAPLSGAYHLTTCLELAIQ